MYYTVGEMAKKLGLAPSTLRYYDQKGLLPFVERTDGGIRRFKDGDCEWLRVIVCLKGTGMKLDDIKSFIEMAMKGDETIELRLELITERKAAVAAQIAELEEVMRVLEFKEWYYKTAKENGTTDVPRNMPTDEIPSELRGVSLKLKNG